MQKNIVKDKKENELQTLYSIYKIKIENSIYINGFFCKIPYELNYISILISTSKILKKKDLKEIKIIHLITNNGKGYKILNINDDRKIYINEQLDISFIEIKETDNIESFFEFDNYTLNKNINLDDLIKNKNIYTLYFPKNNNIIKCLNISKDIFNINNNIIDELYGSPIILSDNSKIIGIINNNLTNNFNLSSAIKEFIFQLNNKKEKLNELTIIYDISNINYDIKIFDDLFVSNNKNNCKLIVNEKEKDLCEHITKHEIDINSNNKILEIKLIEMKKITNMKLMFLGCKELLSLPDFSNWDTNNITDMSFMFYDCTSIKNLPDISKWNTSTVNNMLGMFKSCTSLISLPDISKWDTSNVCNMSCLFFDCSSLQYLPDISKWNTSNLIVIDGMFYDCRSLSYIPDISKWDTRNINSFSYLFYGCESLSFLPDISKWKTNNIKNISWMFGECKSLAFVPDFTKWNFSEIVFVKGVFSGCISVLNFPDISKLNFNRDKHKKHNLFKNSNKDLFEFEENFNNIQDIKKDNNDVDKLYDVKNYKYRRVCLNVIMTLFYLTFFLFLYKIYILIYLN